MKKVLVVGDVPDSTRLLLNKSIEEAGLKPDHASHFTLEAILHGGYAGFVFVGATEVAEQAAALTTRRPSIVLDVGLENWPHLGSFLRSVCQKKILVVDDESQIRDLSREILEGDGFSVTAVSDGLEAMALLIADQEQFDVILSDIKMPKMDGRQLYEYWKGSLSKKSRFIFMTSHNPLEYGIEGCDWVQKPFKIVDLLSIVKGVLAIPLSE